MSQERNVKGTVDMLLMQIDSFNNANQT